jgi:putative glutamine amidotransferase
MRPIIGVTSGETNNLKFPLSPHVQGQQFTYIEAVVRAGGTPIILPIVKDDEVLRQLYEKCDALLLAGGNDVDPELYGKKLGPNATDIRRHRDDQEIQLLNWMMEDDKPVLAICRGMQLLNVALGGSLYQDIPTDLPDAEEHERHSNHNADREHHIAHNLRIDSNSRLANILGVKTIPTNAYHHQAVRELGEGLVPTAWAADGIIEAVELPTKKFVVAVQSHPEALESKIEPRWRPLFKEFVTVSSTKRSVRSRQPALS